MDEFTALFSRKDMTFEEAVAYFKERVPVTASRFYQIAGIISKKRISKRQAEKDDYYAKCHPIKFKKVK
jgi:hypothetical protein